ncbi:type III restriction endonuclease subunit R [Aeromonas dhakensis]|uniref:type III restriction endonuclease subunit R n=1 Tax=Aeromonas dhakensis TaxID=196024 RepID=UPI001118A9FD|nr:type III restriction endonuclease subunit R [Aeromonas dhakensis]
MLKYIMIPCGGGKTFWMCTLVSSDRSKKTIIVHNTIALITETQKQLMQMGCNSTAITSANDPNVMDQVMNFHQNPSTDVLIITDKTFWRLSTSVLKEYRIFLDDVTAVSDFNTHNDNGKEVKNFIIIKLFSERTDVKGNASYITAVKQDVQGDFEKSIKEQFSITDFNDKFVFNKEWFDDPEKVQLSVLAYKDLNKYKNLDITFMANDFENTMVYLAYPDLFTEVKIDARKRTVQLKDRLVVKYFSKNKELTKTWKDSNQDKLKKVYDHLNIELNGKSYYWTKNKSDTNYSLTGTFISPDSRGLNSYQHMNTCVWLACMKPSEVERVCLEDVLGITRDQITQARELEVLHQFVLRGVSRDFNSTEIQTVYVFDEVQAYSLSDNPQYVDLGLDDVEKKKKGAPVKKVTIPKNIRDKKYKFTQKCKKDGITLEIGMFRKWVYKQDDISTEIQDALIEQFLKKR